MYFRKNMDKKPNKIMYIEEGSVFTGVTVSFINLLLHLDKRLYQPIVICLCQGEVLERLRRHKKEFDVIYLWTPFSLYKKIFKKVCRSDNFRFLFIRQKLPGIILERIPLIFGLYLMMKFKKGDLIHFNSYTFYPVVIAAKLAGIPSICHIRGGGALPKAFKIVSRYVKKFIFVSKAIRDSFIAQGIPKDKSIVVYEGIELSRANNESIDSIKEEFKIGKDKFVAGTISRMIPIKGVKYFIEAAVQILCNQPKCKFLIVGGVNPHYQESYAYQAEIKNLINKLNLADKIILTGFRKDAKRILAIFDVFVSASLSEGFPITILEAMTTGIPVVATKVGGIPELIEDNVDGMLVSPADSNAIARVVLALLEDKSLAQRLILNAQNKVQSQFTMELFTERIEKVYEDLLNR